MIKYCRFFILVFSVYLIGSMNEDILAQSASCALCGRTHEQIMTIGHAPGCKYYVAPGAGKTKSSGSSGSSSGAATEALMEGVVNSIINAVDQAAAEQEEADRIKEEAAARREAEAKEKKIAEEKAKDEKLKGSYKPIGGSTDKKEPDSRKNNFIPVSFNCKITAHKGEITIRNTKGETHILRENENIDIHVGDIIKTGKTGLIRMHFAFEKGGEDVTYGSNTTVRIVRGEDGTQQPEVLKGKLRAKSLKLEKDAESPDNTKGSINPNNKNIKRKFEIKTPTAVVSPWGTDFTVSVNDSLETEITVLEGSVDLQGIGNDAIVLIEAGYSGRVSVSGSVSGPEKTDPEKIDKWWIEKE